MEFDYDPMGNRVAKKVTRATQSGDPPSETVEHINTYYQLDAQGNVLATYVDYDNTADQGAAYFVLSENHIYGSKRLGVDSREGGSGIDMTATFSAPTEFTRILGNKHYELSNHLGNVLAVVTWVVCRTDVMIIFKYLINFLLFEIG